MNKKILSLSILMMGVFLLAGCSLIPQGGVNNTVNSKTNTNTVSGTKQTDDLSSKITKTAAVTKRGKLVIMAKNTNSIDVDLDIEVEFYDDSNNLISSEKEYIFGAGAGSEIAVEIYDTPASYSRYDIYIDAKKTSYTKTYFDSIEITHNRTDNVVAQVKNNSNETISSMEAAIVYYNGEEVVGYDSSYASDIKPGRSGNFNFDNPYDNNYDDIEYDNYKIFINEAYSIQ